MAKTTERRRTIRAFHAQSNSKCPADKAEMCASVVVIDAETERQVVGRPNKARPRQCQWKMRRTMTIRRYPQSGASLVQVTATATSTSPTQDNKKKAWKGGRRGEPEIY